MGGGYSGSFTGTTGAIGNNQFHQVSLTDELPVRTKKNGTGSGGGGGMNDDILIITVEMISAMCQLCHKEEISPEQLIKWLDEICTDPKVRLTNQLRGAINKNLPKLCASMSDTSFVDALRSFEQDIWNCCQ